MKRLLFIMALNYIVGFNIYADNLTPQNTDANIIGHVLDEQTKEHLPYVTIQLKGTTVGTTTDGSGHYFFKNLPVGKFTIVVQFVGYKSVEKVVEIIKGKTMELDFELTPSSISLDEVVVSANRNETSRKIAPSLISILDMKTFEATNSNDLSDGLKFQPGLRVENSCQTCGFTQVRINGLDGPYSQVLIDSRPVMGALAGVYGLEQIPANMVERVEVMRGGGSALFGSSAIGGVINVITREPLRNSGEFSHNIQNYNGFNSWLNNTTFNASMINDSRKAGIMVFGHNRIRDGYDHDNDGFTEIAHLKNRSLGFRSFLKTGVYSKLTLEYRNMHEFRRGGDQLDSQPFKASIAEQLEHHINGGGLSFKQSDAEGNNTFSLYSSAQHTLRNSYYGGGQPVASDNLTRLDSYGRTTELTLQLGGQYMRAFDRLMFMPAELTGGVEYLQNNLNDLSGYRLNGVEQITKDASVFFQNEWKNDRWSFLIGGRLDKHNLVDNLIVSPRANVRYNPIENVNIRLSYSEGFRAPQYFDEDLHVDLAGGQMLVRSLDDDLREERSRSVSSSVDYYNSFDNVQLNIMIEGFYTQLRNPFESVTRANEIIVQNSDDMASVYGVNLEGRIAFGTVFQIQSGATSQRSLYENPRKWWEPASNDEVVLDMVQPTRRMMRSPNSYAYFVATWSPSNPVMVNISGNYTGSMLVPHDAGFGTVGVDRFSPVNITETAPSFFEMNLKLAYSFNMNNEIDIELNGGIQNMFNAFQNDFDTGPGRASAYIHGPAAPRSIYAGLKFSF